MLSIETKFAEAMVAIKKAGKAKKFEEVSKTCKSTEEKLNAAEALLKDGGVVREARPIKKNNGAAENFVENNPWNGDRANSFSEGYIKETTNPCAKGDKIMFDSWLKAGTITEAEHDKLTGKKPKGYEALTEAQRKEFDFARKIGINEADAFKIVRAAGTLKEVSRR